MKAIEITNLKKTYGQKFEALKGIDLSIEQGDFFALLGPNGAGKSTTIGILASLVNKNSGKVGVMGYDLDTQLFKVKMCLGIVPQEFNFNVFEKVKNILIQQAGYYGITYKEASIRAEKYLKKLELWDKRNETASSLSGGMKRRLMIARAMIHEPSILILDEPTAGVDVEIRHIIWEFLKKINQSGTTIILTTHYLEEVEELCNNVAILNHGNIVVNTPIKELLSKIDEQTYVIDTKENITNINLITDFELKKIDSNCIEITLKKELALNYLFEQLSKNKITITNIRTKSTRLESLFLKLTSEGKK